MVNACHLDGRPDLAAFFLRFPVGGAEFDALRKGYLDALASDVEALFHWSSDRGHVALLRHLLEHEAVDVNSLDKSGSTALSKACWNGALETVKLLVEHKAALDLQNRNGYTGLMRAALRNHLEVVSFLLLEGASTAPKTKRGKDALAIAQSKAHVDVIGLLID